MLPTTFALVAFSTRGKGVSDLPLKPSARPLWPAAMIVLGFSLTAAWVILLGYGLVRLVMHAI